MKIGILTYHRSYNFGALLQAMALRQKIADQGHDVYIINYWPFYHYNMYALFPPRTLWHLFKGKHLKAVLRYFKYWHKRYKKMRVTKAFINKYSRPYWAKYSPKVAFDVVVYGSDQIWRKQDGLEGRFNPVYFGENIITTKKSVSYAGSMGKLELDDEDKRYLFSTLSRFDMLSTRETSLNDLLLSLGLKSEVVIDPTLLLTAKEWDSLLDTSRIIKEKYVLFYQVLKYSIDEEQAMAYARSHGLRYVKLLTTAVTSRQDDYVIETASPETFVSLIKHAEMVFTSSFHGLVFCITYNKPFYASYVENSSRAESIMEAVGLKHCLLPPMGKIPDAPPVIDYDEVNKRMADLRKSSIDFIKRM